MKNIIKANWILGPILLGLYLTTFYHYLLFHTLVEIFSVTVAWMMFAIVWSAKDKHVNGFYIILGVAYLFIGSIDLIHTLAYKGMNIFSGYDANLPTQMWILARYLEAITLFTAQFYLKDRPNINVVLTIYLVTCFVFVSLIFMGYFPNCYIEGKGLTTFKIASEYIISGILLGAIFYLRKNRTFFSNQTYCLIMFAIICTIIAELLFTFYISVYGISNLLGHYFKLISFYLVYKSIVKNSIQEPYDTIFNELKEREAELLKEKELLLKALEKIKTFEGLLPICASCKRIKDENNNWVQVEEYVTEHSDVKFSHGICPECMKKLYPHYYNKIKNKLKK